MGLRNKRCILLGAWALFFVLFYCFKTYTVTQWQMWGSLEITIISKSKEKLTMCSWVSRSLDKWSPIIEAGEHNSLHFPILRLAWNLLLKKTQKARYCWKKKSNPLSDLRLNIFLILNLRCWDPFWKVEEVFRSAKLLLFLRKKIVSFQEKFLEIILEKKEERKIGEQIASLAEGEACKSERLCPRTWMTRKRTLIKKDALSYYMDNDFDLKIWLLFDIIKELMFFCLFYGLHLICHLMDLLIIPAWNAWGYFMCTEVHYGHLLALSSISCLTITNIDL